MSDLEENDEICVDADTCSESELNKLFSDSLVLSSEQCATNDYILFLDSTSDFTQLAAASPNNTIALYNLNVGKSCTQFGAASELKAASQQICGIRFAPRSSTTLYVSTSNAIQLYDVRTKASPVQLFQASSPKVFTCFDVNANGKVICAGTEQAAGEANLLFFDVRANAPLATYTDSHRDDVTQVKYHPTKRNYVATGSTDGLINIFDTNEPDEDDALENCLNTESSIQTIAWHTAQTSADAEQQDCLACVTHTNDFQLFDVENSDLEFKCERADIAAAIRRKVAGDCYLVNSHMAGDGQLFCLAGSNSNNGECLRSLRIRSKEFVPLHNFVDNKQIVRCSLFNSKENVLVTAGESGLITLWEHRATSQIEQTHKISHKAGKKDKRKSKPY